VGVTILEQTSTDSYHGFGISIPKCDLLVYAEYENSSIKTGIKIKTHYIHGRTKKDFKNYQQAKEYIRTDVVKGTWENDRILKEGKIEGETLHGVKYSGKPIKDSPSNEILIKWEDGRRYKGQLYFTIRSMYLDGFGVIKYN
jgi:hypothetical protein